MDHYIGIDVGTGSARACIINANGDIVGEGSKATGRADPEHLIFEDSTVDIWSGVCDAVKAAIKQNDTDPNLIRGIGFDATCSLAVFNHETDEPISVTGPDFNSGLNVIMWFDQRPTEEAVQISRTASHELLRYVGGEVTPEMEICKVLWLKKHMPTQLFEKCAFYDLADALVHIATGNQKRDFPSVDRRQDFLPIGIDGSIKGWKEEFLDRIGLGELAQYNYKRIGGVNESGDYLSAGELVGHLCEKAASEMGLPSGIAVGSGVIDSYAGWIGTVGGKAELESDDIASGNEISQAFTRLAAVAGTSSCHLIMSQKQVFVDHIWGPFHDVLLPGYCITEGGQTATGELLKHVIQTHPAYEQADSQAKTQGLDIFQYLDGHLAQMKHDRKAPFISYLARHLFFYGDLWGNRSPFADPNMTGSIIGLTGEKTVNALAIHYYATLEFIALQTKQIVEAMTTAGHCIRSIFMSGSQCKNDILVALIATACKVPVVTPEYSQSAVCHGAAMLGAKAASADADGKTENLWSIMNRMSRPGKMIVPTQNEQEISLLEAKYEIFVKQCETQREYRNSIDEVVNKWV